jgi:hypothetical protein
VEIVWEPHIMLVLVVAAWAIRNRRFLCLYDWDAATG